MSRQKKLHRTFAQVSPVFTALVFALVLMGPGSAQAGMAAGSGTAAVKRHAAETQFARAEEQRAALNSKPLEKRSLADYRQVITTFRRVFLITPHATEVPTSLVAIAELYTEMGDRFGQDFYQSALEYYQSLLREYPTSRYCPDAMLRSAKLQKDKLGDAAGAAKTYEVFLKRYQRSSQRREAQESLAELALSQSDEKKSSPASVVPAAASAQANANPAAREVMEEDRSALGVTQPLDLAKVARIRNIRATANDEATRVIIDLQGSVQYASGRISNPDRIFFDLHAARLTPEVAHGNIKVEGNLLTGVRVAQNHAEVVRVVLDVRDVKDYTASLSDNRLLIDLYGKTAPSSEVRTAKSKASLQPSPSEDAGNNAPDTSRDNSALQSVAAKSVAVVSNTTAAETSPNPSSVADGGETASSNTKISSKPLRATNLGTKPDLIQPSTAPLPTHDGQSTLTRALGLKIGRIVIDPGHGGHDTGTVGPTGLMEKDLCLDVALRLSKIIQQKLPGADVVLTRTDDTFVPLEERTNIANESKADLFISIHANSSQDHAARGFETYYLNLRGTPEAMEVAARENSVSQGGIHNLEDMVKKIARNEKSGESKEFAEDIQNSLSQRIQKMNKPVKNRGVRKAPFVVLIGADMPSILTEISFLSNAADEQLLKKPEHRQRLAEGLYQGVASYLHSLNSVTMNVSAKHASHRTTTASVEQSRNPQ